MFEKVQFSRSKLSDFWGFIPTQAKTALKDGFQKWCALLCAYPTEKYDDYKQLGYKLELIKY